MYQLIRPLLFQLDAERSHHLAFAMMQLGYRVPGFAAWVRRRYAKHTPALPVETMGLRFPNPVGLAAGLDKDARHVCMLADMGFGWLELGTVTPQPQGGNPKRRLFRLPGERALINRMGFNNAGLAAFVDNLTRTPKPCLIGINIGKNRDTPIERAVEDYVYALRTVYIHAAYVAINISSPNTPGLRALQEQDRLGELLAALKIEQAALTHAYHLHVPLALKIAPDLSDEQIDWIAETVLAQGFDAVIATNTTLARPGMDQTLLANEAGGLSGRPLKALATRTINRLYRVLQGRVPIIGVGGIENSDDAWEKLVAGADLLQVYTSFIYEGPALVRRIVSGLAARVATTGQLDLTTAVASARSAAAGKLAAHASVAPRTGKTI